MTSSLTAAERGAPSAAMKSSRFPWGHSSVTTARQKRLSEEDPAGSASGGRSALAYPWTPTAIEGRPARGWGGDGRRQRGSRRRGIDPGRRRGGSNFWNDGSILARQLCRRVRGSGSVGARVSRMGMRPTRTGSRTHLRRWPPRRRRRTRGWYRRRARTPLRLRVGSVEGASAPRRGWGEEPNFSRDARMGKGKAEVSEDVRGGSSAHLARWRGRRCRSRPRPGAGPT